MEITISILGIFMTIKDYMIDIVDILNDGLEINVTEFAKKNDLHRRTISNYLNNFKTCFELNSLTNNHGKWKIRRGFLKHLGLNTEELVTILDLYISSSNSIDKLSVSQKNIATLYRNNKLILDKDNGQETLTQTMIILIGNINEAINTKRKIQILFNGHYRIIQPFKVFKREYYWYFAGYEEEKYELNNEENMQTINHMKTYSIRSIRSVKILQHEYISHPFTGAEEILKNSLNGYMSWNKEPHNILLAIKNTLSEKIQKVNTYSHWTYSGPIATLPEYDFYKTKSVHDEFKDIIPTILKYTPNILILEPPELRDIIFKQLQAFYSTELSTSL